MAARLWPFSSSAIRGIRSSIRRGNWERRTRGSCGGDHREKRWTMAVVIRAGIQELNVEAMLRWRMFDEDSRNGRGLERGCSWRGALGPPVSSCSERRPMMLGSVPANPLDGNGTPAIKQGRRAAEDM